MYRAGPRRASGLLPHGCAVVARVYLNPCSISPPLLSSNPDWTEGTSFELWYLVLPPAGADPGHFGRAEGLRVDFAT